MVEFARSSLVESVWIKVFALVKCARSTYSKSEGGALAICGFETACERDDKDVMWNGLWL